MVHNHVRRTDEAHHSMDQDPEGHGSVDAGTRTGRTPGCGHGNSWFGGNTKGERKQSAWMGAAHADLQLATGAVGWILDARD
eukprot:7785901-Heterocapsa_arctica.AAC.1